MENVTGYRITATQDDRKAVICLLKMALPIWWGSFFTLIITCASTAIINVALIINNYFIIALGGVFIR